jgi:hypothetical protein
MSWGLDRMTLMIPAARHGHLMSKSNVSSAAMSLFGHFMGGITGLDAIEHRNNASINRTYGVVDFLPRRFDLDNIVLIF